MGEAHHLIPSVVAIAISKFCALKTGTPSTFLQLPFWGIVFRSLLAALTYRTIRTTSTKKMQKKKRHLGYITVLRKLYIKKTIPASHLERIGTNEAFPAS